MRAPPARLSSVLLVPALLLSLAAGEAPPDKSGYTLFHPTPTKFLREFDTDRPDQTEGPAPVDAGHFQLELDFVNHTRDRTSTVLSRSTSVAPVNLRIGLTNRIELSLVYESFVEERTTDRLTGEKTRTRGTGDFLTRLKINLWGADDGTTAFALFPFVKWPVATHGLGNRSVEGGLILPFSISISDDWGLGMQTRGDIVRKESGRGYEGVWINSISLSYGITKRLGTYVELYSSVMRKQKWQGQIDVGFTYELTTNTQLDLGCNFGVTKSAPDLNPFMGFAVRW